MKKITFLIAVLLAVITAAGCSSSTSDKVQSDYPTALVWNGTYYFTSVATVPQEQVGEKLGEIKKQVKPMPQKNGEANFLPVGTQIFSINGEDSKETIAVKRGDEYHKATVNKNPFNYTKEQLDEFKKIAWDSLSDEERKLINENKQLVIKGYKSGSISPERYKEKEVVAVTFDDGRSPMLGLIKVYINPEDNKVVEFAERD